MCFTLSKFCIYCGVEDSIENPVIENICLKCRLERSLLLKIESEIVFEICRSCFSIKIGFKWIETTGLQDALDYVINKKLLNFIEKPVDIKFIEIVKYEFLTNPSWRTRVRVYLKIKYRDYEFIAPIEVTIVFKPVKCFKCINLISGEYDAVVQIRGFDLDYLKTILNNVLNKSDLVENIVDIIEKHNGCDIYFFNKSYARRFVKTLLKSVSNKYRVSVKESFEHIGSKHGVDRYRLVISIKAM